jgi:uncharacterized membrane protein YfcA
MSEREPKTIDLNPLEYRRTDSRSRPPVVTPLWARGLALSLGILVFLLAAVAHAYEDPDALWSSMLPTLLVVMSLLLLYRSRKRTVYPERIKEREPVLAPGWIFGVIGLLAVVAVRAAIYFTVKALR